MSQNHPARILSSAIRLQASRSFLRDLKGLGATSEGQEFAKAIAEAGVEGMTPAAIVEEVVKAMGGNENAALDLLQAVQEIAKAHVEAYTRTLPNGKTVQVNAYENARTGSMKSTTLAHGATFHAMRTKSPEAHENAARMHEEAADQHKKAFEIHPRDVAEVGTEHSNLQAQHQLAAEYHKNEAKQIRENAAYSKAKSEAEGTSEAVGRAHDGRTKAMAHEAAAKAHMRAAAVKPGQGHEEKAEGHTAMHLAHRADSRAGLTPLGWKDGRSGAMASEAALGATTKAVASGKREDHGRAAALHAKAAEAHMQIHGEHETTEEGHHAQVAQDHMRLHAYHLGKGSREEIAKAIQDWNAENRDKLKEGKIAGEFAGPNETFPIHSPKDITHAFMLAHHAENPDEVKANIRRIAKEHGWESHVPEEDQPKEEEVGKAHIEGYTRTVHGRVVQVHPYDTTKEKNPLRMEANSASERAEKEGTEEAHLQAAEAHKKASQVVFDTRTDSEGLGKMRYHQSMAREHAAEADKKEGERHSQLAAHVAYHTPVKLKGYQRPLRPSQMMSASDAGKALIHNNPDWTKEDHQRLAADHHAAAAYHDEQWGKKADEAAKATFGRPYQFTDYKISGIASDKFSDEHKDALRHHAHAGSFHKQMEVAHEAAANTRNRYADKRGQEVAKAILEEDTEEIGKAQVQAHTRTQGGKVVQVQSYETHQQAAHAASTAAHAATGRGAGMTPEAHAQAASAHMKAATAHREASQYAPEDWMKKGHEDQAKLHEHYAKGHDMHARTAGTSSDTGVDQPKHTPDSIKKLEGHEDYSGFGYLGHERRSPDTDKALAEAANRANMGHHELAAHVLSKSGRHMMDDHPTVAGHEQRVAHMQRWISNPKNKETYGIKDYAKKLEEGEKKEGPKSGAEGSGAAAAKPAAKPAPAKPAAASEEQSHHQKALAAAEAVKGASGKEALPYSKAAHAASEAAEKSGKPEDHYIAHTLHMGAGMSHNQSYEDSGYKKEGHQTAFLAHKKAEAYHKSKMGDAKVSPAEMRAAAAKYGVRD